MIKRNFFKSVHTFHFVFCMMLFFTAGCTSSKKLAENRNVKALSTTEMQQLLEEHNVDFDWFSGKARVIVHQDQNRMGGTVLIRMLKDQFIWMSINKLGFEVARAYIRPDSAFVIDRFNKDFYAENLEDYLAEYRVPFTFQELQGLLLGNIPYEKGNKSRSRLESGLQYLTQKNSNNLFFEYVFASDQSINQVFVRDPQDRKVVSLLSDYKTSGQRIIPFNIEHQIKDKDETFGMEIDYSNVEFDVEKNVPFEIPAHYTRIQ